MERVVTKMGDGGRLVIPVEYRRALGVEPGDELVLVLEENSVRVLTPREGIRRAQALVRSYVSEGERLSDELIQERRRSADRE
jgi:bifunctional DNA-binding transcriptional regulator/antitoxin component of YhaV-PrlF toxin-antitoxin module